MIKYSNFMLDIETLGTKPNAAVVQIGCVGFDTDGNISLPFTVSVTPHPDSSMDFSTIQWWMGQADEARKSVFDKQFFDPAVGLEQLNQFIADNSDEVVGYKVWSKPSTFDIVILESLYRACGYAQAPWAHWNTRCLRTLLDDAKFPRSSEVMPRIPHDAGYDAEAQALNAISAKKKLDSGNP